MLTEDGDFQKRSHSRDLKMVIFRRDFIPKMSAHEIEFDKKMTFGILTNLVLTIAVSNGEWPLHPLGTIFRVQQWKLHLILSGQNANQWLAFAILTIRLHCILMLCPYNHLGWNGRLHYSYNSNMAACAPYGIWRNCPNFCIWRSCQWMSPAPGRPKCHVLVKDQNSAWHYWLSYW